MHIDIGDGREDVIYINENSDPYKEAIFFCERHVLEPYISKLLGDSLKEQIENEKKISLEEKDQQQKSEKTELTGADRILKSKICKRSKIIKEE